MEKNVNNLDIAKKLDTTMNNIDDLPFSAISPFNAAKIIYYMMTVDGEIEEREAEKFNLIGKELDPDFVNRRDYIVKACKKNLDKAGDGKDYYEVVQNGVEEALLSKQVFDKGYVPSKMLVWDLLALVYSDNSYNDLEKKLMIYIVNKLKISKDVFLEMENSYLTVNDLERELEWIKSTNRPYLTIDAQVKEIERREQVIYESIKALILL